MAAERTIAVVIPFFQRDSGLLRRAVTSVLEQALPADLSLRVVIVDDSSPVPALDEIRDMTERTNVRFTVLRQANAGPGAARNRALDELNAGDVTFVAFLDSDDEWKPNHLSTALAALSDNSDMYFCDHTRFDKKGSFFEESNLFADWQTGRRTPSPVPMPGQASAFTMPGKGAADAFLIEYISQTSTVVYRFGPHAGLRFDTALRHAGEDHLFFITLALHSRNVAFSTERNAYCGEGVNVYYSSFDWSRPQAASRYGSLLLLLGKLEATLDLDRSQKSEIRNRARRFARAYSYLLVRSLLRRHLPDMRLLIDLAVSSPARLLSLPYLFGTMLIGSRQGDWNW